MYTQEDVVKVQNRLLEIALNIRDILERNSIPYFLSSGSLLGAIRHTTFIPWDDDLDMYLFEDSYDCALECLRKELPSDCFVEYFDSEPLYFHDWAHVKDVNTICDCSHFPQDSLYTHKGISIDLYKMSSMKRNEWADFKYAKAVEYLNNRKKHGFINQEEYDTKMSIFEDQLKERKLVECSNEMIFASSVSKHIFNYDDILPLTDVTISGVRFHAPHNPDAFLKEIYGNYMELPPIEKRVPHYSMVKFLDNVSK